MILEAWITPKYTKTGIKSQSVQNELGDRSIQPRAIATHHRVCERLTGHEVKRLTFAIAGSWDEGGDRINETYLQI
jgi:hypothetical protein